VDYRVYVIQKIASQNFTSVCLMMLREGSPNTILDGQNGPKARDLGSWFGKVTSYRFQKRENWKSV